MRGDRSSKKQSGPTTRYGRQIVYDREICITICTRILRGEDPVDICAKPPMPIAPVFLEWIKEHKEAREIYRSMENFQSDRGAGRKFGVPLAVTPGEWAEQVRANCERGWPLDWIERKYIPPDWSKVYPSVGDEPPVLSAEDRQAYDDLIASYTMRLEPRDEIELFWTKQAVDARWEVCRIGRDKKALLEHKCQQWLQFVAQHRRRNGGAEPSRSKSATVPDLRLRLEADSNYQALDIAHSRAMKRHDEVLREIARYRRDLGAAPRTLPHKFVDEQILAHRYGLDRHRLPPRWAVDRYPVDEGYGVNGSGFDQFAADAENDATADEAVKARPPVAPAGAAQAAPPRDTAAEKAVEAVSSRASSNNITEAQPSLTPADEAPASAQQRAGADEAESREPVPVAIPSNEAAQAEPSLTPTDEIAQGASPLIPSDEVAEAEPQLAASDGAAQAAHAHRKASTSVGCHL